ncbi:MAG: peptidylprolyl isomerase [Anaerolineae bacterium]|jgi:peptidylprolyl isomerase/peptidyl-prolyl cis-trans isomerase B (cyclophilin B)|nr:peptidylprolyl isomerase [Anaerolineae bacterium]
MMNKKLLKTVMGVLLSLGLLVGLVACAPAAEVPPTATVAPAETEEPVQAPTDEPAESAPSDLMQYSAPPEMQIDPAKYYAATIETEKRDITVELFAAEAPKTVNNFVFLAREGFYDNTTFHRVIAGFMAQGGDPTGTGRGGPGYEFADEFTPALSHDRAGTLSMANAGANTNGSQFFITYIPTPWLDDLHTDFGRVIKGMDVLPLLSERDPENAVTPGDLIKTISISESEEPFPSDIPAAETVVVPANPIERNGLYLQPPVMAIDSEKSYEATIVTPKGEIVVALDAAAAPQTVNNFVFLAQQGFYDGLTFHRVESDFVIQGGDPLGSGQGGSGYLVPAEIGLEHVEGALAMARMGDQGNPRRMSSGSQFYITLTATPMLDGAYTVFGRVVEGMDVVKATAVGDIIEQITVEEK